MTLYDQTTLILTIWRENRAGGQQGMASVANVILNRAARDNSAVADECLKRLQFSSMTYPADPEIRLGPDPEDAADWAAWQTAVNIAVQAASGNLPDLTGGATLYYAPRGIQTTATIDVGGQAIPFPQKWDEAAVEYTATIANQVFFREV
jgi:hypothetical protein